MTDIMMVFACLNQSLHPTVLRQLTVVAQAMLAMTGRVTMLGLSRWAGQGGSYRTIQRFSDNSIIYKCLCTNNFTCYHGSSRCHTRCDDDLVSHVEPSTR